MFFGHIFCDALMYCHLLQDRVGRLRGGIEFLQLCGFERDQDEFLTLPREKEHMDL